MIDTDIRNIYRLKKSPNKFSPIIMEFSSTSLKESKIKASKTPNKDNKGKLNTTHLKLYGEPKPIFISESLTTCGRRLYYLAREYVKNHKFSSCWTSYGKVYIRRKEGDEPILISREEDMIKLNSQWLNCSSYPSYSTFSLATVYCFKFFDKACYKKHLFVTQQYDTNLKFTHKLQLSYTLTRTKLTNVQMNIIVYLYDIHYYIRLY